jgi:hypothetical protein
MTRARSALIALVRLDSATNQVQLSLACGLSKGEMQKNLPE